MTPKRHVHPAEQRSARRHGPLQPEAEAPEAEETLAQCVEAVEHLLDLFSNDDSGCDVVDGVLDDLNEASEMMILMQVEGGEGPAADAVTMLLQLRREIDMKLAA